MTRNLAFLVTPSDAQGDPHNDNAQRIPQAFMQAGWQVQTAAHNDLQWRNDALLVGTTPAADFDLIWPIGLGPRATFLDRLQLMHTAAGASFITRPGAYTALHGKGALLQHGPESFISPSAEALARHMRDQPGDWVLKPLAGSFGRQVVRVSTVRQIEQALDGDTSGYWMLQRFVPAITRGEIRTLVCCNQIIGSYRRVPGDELHANLATGAQAEPTTLSGADAERVSAVHAELLHQGVGFAAIDTVDGRLMEVNIANPGGLATLDRLYGGDHAAALVRAVEAGLSSSR